MTANSGHTMVFRAQLRFFIALTAMAISLSARAAIPDSERNVLLALYASTNGSGWSNNTGWNGPAGTECSWHGVFCDGTSSHVFAISLSNNILVGTLPAIGDLT